MFKNFIYQILNSYIIEEKKVWAYLLGVNNDSEL